MTKQRFTLNTTVKLKSPILIGHLFKYGKVKYSTNLRVHYKYRDVQDDETSFVPWKVAFSVPKRIWKRAVDRNRIKRQLREAFRLNQNLVEQRAGKQLHLMFVFTASQHLASDALHEEVVSIMKRLK